MAPHAGNRRASRALLLAAGAALLSQQGPAFTSLLAGVRPSAPLAVAPARRQLNVVRFAEADGEQAMLTSVKKGDRVQVQFENIWYDCDVLDASADGTVATVRYDDGGDEEGDVEVASRIREIPPPMALKKGQMVEVQFEGQWWDAEILSVGKDGETCGAKYIEGGDEEEDIEVRQRVREPRLKLADLEVGKKMQGTVVSVAPFGCFVDIGAERDGLVHISRMSEARVESTYDVVSEGQQIDVWVSQVTDDGKLGLSMLESKIGGGGGGGRRAPADYTPFLDVADTEWLTGTVASIAPFGVFVTVTPPNGGDPVDGLVHIAQIRDGFVENTADEVDIGQEVKVRVTRVDMDAGRMGLSMKEGGGGGGGGRAPREKADLTPFEGIAASEWLSGKVARTAPFGIFVTVTTADGASSADGLVHITQIRDGFVENTEDEVEEGQEVDVRVLSVDAGAGKMSLSMKEDDGGDNY